jgi:hypothetical protein
MNIAFLTHKEPQSERLLRLKQCASLPNTLVQVAHPDIRSALKAPPRRGKTLLEAQAHHEPPSGITIAKGGIIQRAVIHLTPLSVVT